MKMRIDEICTYAPKSGIKAGEATKDGQYMFFTSSEDESKRYTDYQYDGEGIIMGTGGNATLHYYHGKYAVSTDCIVLNPDDRVRCKYLYYFFLANMPILEAGFKGAGLKHTNKKYIGSITIPELPPYDEQDRVIEVLDKISGIINARNLEIAALDDLIKARFVEMFGNPVDNDLEWDTITLNEACDGVGDGLHGTPEYDDNGDYPFINGNNLIDGTIEITPATKHVNEETYKKHYIDLSSNAILISINGTLGKLAFYNGEEVMLGKSACYCNLKPEIQREFVYGVMKSDAFARFLDENSTASTIKNVGLKAMRNFRLIMPPDNLQNSFIAFAKQVDKSKFVA